MINPLTSMAGNFGTFFVSNTTKVTKRFIGFKVDADCTITEITEGSTTDDVRATYLAVVGAKLPAGTIVKCGGDIFTSITLGGGSVTLILEG